MFTKNIFYTESLYKFLIFLSLTIFFFSTEKSNAKAFDIDNIEVSQPFEMNFNKNKVIDEGFKKAFSDLILLIVNSSDQKKIGKIKLNSIKAMIDSFSIKEEKFIDEIYYVNLGVTFNKKAIFNFLEKKNIFPSIPLKNKFLFIPIVIDEKLKDLLIFSDNKIYNDWNKSTENFQLIEYILPTEDLEDLNFIKKRYDLIEQYDFKEITKKYDLKNSIISLIFINNDKVRVLSRITINKNVVLKNQTFTNINIKDENQVKELVKNLKIFYEDFWKSENQINTSIKLPLRIKINNTNDKKVLKFEKILKETDLVYDFFISKIDKDYVYFQIIFNGSTNNFIQSMQNNDLNFDTQNKIWILK